MTGGLRVNVNEVSLGGRPWADNAELPPATNGGSAACQKLIFAPNDRPHRRSGPG